MTELVLETFRLNARLVEAAQRLAKYGFPVKQIVTGGSDQTIRFWDIDGKPGMVLKGHTSNAAVPLVFTPDGGPAWQLPTIAPLDKPPAFAAGITAVVDEALKGQQSFASAVTTQSPPHPEPRPLTS